MGCCKLVHVQHGLKQWPAKYWLHWMGQFNFTIKQGQSTYQGEFLCWLRMDELLVILHSCQNLTSVLKSHNRAPKVAETDSAHKWQCKLSITSTKKQNHQDCSVVVCPVTAAAMKINLKKTQAGGKISGLTHTGHSEWGAGVGHRVLYPSHHLTPFSPSFRKSVSLSCPRPAFEPENTQIRGGGGWGGRKAELVQWRGFYSSQEKKK